MDFPPASEVPTGPNRTFLASATADRLAADLTIPREEASAARARSLGRPQTVDARGSYPPVHLVFLPLRGVMGHVVDHRHADKAD